MGVFLFLTREKEKNLNFKIHLFLLFIDHLDFVLGITF